MKDFCSGWTAAMREGLKTAAGALLILFVANAFADPARTVPLQPLTVQISNIEHLHGGDYLVEVCVVNKTSAPIDLVRSDLLFSAQSDVLGRWIELAWRRDADPRNSTSALLPDEERKIRIIVTVPENLPHLYRNHEGDVNILFRYTFACPAGPGSAEPAYAGESAYWLTPGTSRWVLREGM